MAELQMTGKQQRYDRLQTLLSRSNLYATYLLDRMNQRNEAEQQKKVRLEKREKKQEEKELNNKDEQVLCSCLFCVNVY